MTDVASRPDLVFGEPSLGVEEIAALAECLHSGWIGLGPRVARFEADFCEYKSRGAQEPVYAAAVSSGTAALHVSLVAMGIGPGDEVIAPTLTFCATVHSIVHAGATPVLVDCGPDFNVTADLIEQRITSRTKALIVVHMCGRCCDMEPILVLARRHQLRVIEDCAHAIEASEQGRPAGLAGDAGCFSFYPTKSVTTGEGGMVISRDPELIGRVRVLSRQGMTQDAWTRVDGQHEETGAVGYSVVAAGFKYNMTDIAAALGCVQLKSVEDRWQKRERIWLTYNRFLSGTTVLPPLPVREGDRHALHLYTVLVPRARDRVIGQLRKAGIGSGVHYVPVHMQPYYRDRFGFKAWDFPQAWHVGERTLSLPLSAKMEETDAERVAATLLTIVERSRN